MLKSLHTKIVLILVTLVLSVMTIVGTFLMSSVTEYNISKFQKEMVKVFTDDFLVSLQQTAQTKGSNGLREFVMAYAGSLGINQNRNFYILEGETGKYITGSDDKKGETLELTPNVLTAMNGMVGQEIRPAGAYFDVSIPIKTEDASFVLEVLDNKEDLNAFTMNLTTSLFKAMIFGLVIVILLSFVLSKTITNPVEKITKTATKIADGDFEDKIEVDSIDEIGTLTETFNEMASRLKSTIDAMAGEQNKLNTMFEHMKDGIVAFDKDGKMIHINPAAVKMLNIENQCQHYKDVFQNLHIDKDDLNNSGKYIEIDYAVRGSILKLFIAPFDSGDGGGLIVVLHDVTEQKKLDDSRREFVANVSHELRTPLTNVKGYTETLLSADDIDLETRKSFLTVVHGEADRMTRIVKDLLTLSRLDYGKMDIKEEVIRFDKLIENAVDAMRIESKKQGIDMICNPLPKLNIMGDNERLTQIIVNVISNAIKYNKPEGKIFVACQIQKEKAVLTVKDTGLGIPKEDLPRIFERFYRVDKARSRERGGTGLGLAIAKEITEQHKGTMEIDSIYTEGTTVTLKFPIIGEQDGEN